MSGIAIMTNAAYEVSSSSLHLQFTSIISKKKIKFCMQK